MLLIHQLKLKIQKKLKRLKVFDFLSDKKLESTTNELSSTIQLQYNEYINKISSIGSESLEDTRTFWLNHKDFWPELAHYA
jgi:hypothetical protein